MQYRTERGRKAAGGRLALLLVLVLTLMLTVAPGARADGRFVYEACDPSLPGGNPPTVLSFYNEPGVNYEWFQTCAAPGGSVGLGQKAGPVKNWFAILQVAVPTTPAGWVESVTMTASAGSYQGNYGRIVRQAGSEPEAPEWPMAGGGEEARPFFLRSQAPTPAEAAAEPFPVFDIFLGCHWSFTQCEPGAYIAAQFITAVEVDPSPPIVRRVEGSLVGGNILRGHQIVKAEASDLGGGVRSLELKVNGVSMPGTAYGACSLATVSDLSYQGVVATSATPCPASLSDTWDVDTSAAPFQNGANSVQVCASDLSTKGTPNVGCSAPQTVQVDNTCTESPVAGGANLSAAFSQNDSDDLTVGFGNPTEITGQLTDQTGTPISGATICLESQPAGSSIGPTQTVGSVRTDGEGRFSIEVAPGANRTLMVGYRHDSFQVEKKLSLATRARPTIKLNTHKIRGGKKIQISGKLPQPNPGGRVLVLQGSSAHGKVWLTFKRVTTAPDGSYQTTYTFAKPRRPTGFRIRVDAPAQAGYEYDPGTSSPAHIKVRP